MQICDKIGTSRRTLDVTFIENCGLQTAGK